MSDAKTLLEDDLLRGVIPLKSCPGFMPKDVHQMRPEYQAIPYKTWTSRLYNARRRHLRLQKQAVDHAAALANSRVRYPVQLRNERGQLRWEGSAGAAFLKLDVAEGRHLGLLPAQFRATRPEYMVHDPVVFRRHIYQEEKTQKYIEDQKARSLARSRRN
jgi:hypothetical protein